jgi:hypothetical protein
VSGQSQSRLARARDACARWCLPETMRLKPETETGRRIPPDRERDLLALLRDARDAAARIGLLMRDGERAAVGEVWVEIAQRIDTALGGKVRAEGDSATTGARTHQVSHPSTQATAYQRPGGDSWQPSAYIPGPTIPPNGPFSPASSAGGSDAATAAPARTRRHTIATGGRTTAADQISKPSATLATSGSTGCDPISRSEGEV